MIKNFSLLQFLFALLIPCYTQIHLSDSINIQKVLDLNNITSKNVADVSLTNGNQRVVSLNLEKLGIDSLPPEIGQLTFLEEFKLNENNLTNLPIEIKNLSNLFICDAGICLGSVGLVVDNNKLCNLSPELQNWLDTTYFYAYQNIDWRDTQDCSSNMIFKKLFLNGIKAIHREKSSIEILFEKPMIIDEKSIIITDVKGIKSSFDVKKSENKIQIENIDTPSYPKFVHFKEKGVTLKVGQE